MNYEQKKEIVEKLKQNWDVTMRLDSVSKLVLFDMNKKDCLVMQGDGTFTRTFGLIFGAGNVYRIAPDYQLPEPKIDPPDGYRIVSIEDRKRCKYPADCIVKYQNKVFVGARFVVSGDADGWDYKHLLFAVPSDYVFAEDRKKKGEWKRYPVRNEDGVWMALGRQRLSSLPDLKGFGGVAFADFPDEFWNGFSKYTEDGGPIDPVAVRFWVEV